MNERIAELEKKLTERAKWQAELSRAEKRLAMRIQQIIILQTDIGNEMDELAKALEEERRQTDPKRHFIRWWGR